MTIYNIIYKKLTKEDKKTMSKEEIIEYRKKRKTEYNNNYTKVGNRNKYKNNEKYRDEKKEQTAKKRKIISSLKNNINIE